MAFILNLVFSVVALMTTFLAAIFLARQKLTYFTNVRNYLVLIFLGFAALVVVSIYSVVEPSVVWMRVGVTSYVFVAVAAGLAVANLADYPEARSSRELFAAAVKKPKLLLIVYMGVMLVALFSTWVPQLNPSLQQFSMALLYDPLSGEMIYLSVYEPWYGIMLLMIVIAFLFYPTLKLFSLSIQVQSEGVKKSIKALNISLAAVATSLFVFSVTFAQMRYSVVYVGYLVDSVFFGLVAYSFRKNTVLSVFTETARNERSFGNVSEGKRVFRYANAFSRALGLDHRQVIGRKILFEFDPVSNYERTIRDFVAESLANDEQVVVFTRRGSAIYSSLGEQEAVRFFCLTQQVSVPREFSQNELLLPSTDTSIVLNAFDTILKTNPELVINVVFDSLSDSVLSIGFEKTYHFMRDAAEMLASPKVTALFLLNRAAHNPKVASILGGLFSNRISCGKRGVETIKLPEANTGSMEVEKFPLKEKGRR